MNANRLLQLSPLILAYSLLVMVLGFLFGAALVGRERLAFRDVSHFYTPLYEYVAARQSEQWLPLWNPLDLTGLPLAGETTTAVFYPLRMLVYTIAPTPETAIAWYVVLHLLIAGCAIHVAARTAGAGSLGCAIALLTYPLSGPIFFLVYNPPFLVGAAWMPIAIAGGLQLLEKPTGRWLSITGLALALPILGGDPQTSIHVLLLGLAAFVVRCCRRWRDHWTLRVREFGRLVAATLLGSCIAAPQLAASIDWGRQSGRMNDSGTMDRYDFSVPPWHWIELVVPEASGRLFPIYTRISHSIPGDGRTWVLTLYTGMVALVLAMSRYLKSVPLTPTLSPGVPVERGPEIKFDLWDWLAPIGLLLAISGPYWLLVTLVPGYEAFRYPAKWLTIVPLGLAVSAARQVEPMLLNSSRIMQTTSLLISALALTTGLASVLAPSLGALEYLESLQLVDRFWGPLRPERAFQNIAWSAVCTALVACMVGVLAKLAANRFVSTENTPIKKISLVLSGSLILLVAIDLALASRPQIATINIAEEKKSLTAGLIKIEPTPLAAGPIESAGNHFGMGRTMRTVRDPEWPKQWLLPHDGNSRLLEVELNQRLTNFGRWHLFNRQATFNSTTSLRPQRTDAFWAALKSSRLTIDDDANRQAWKRLENWLGINAPLYRWDSQFLRSDQCQTVSADDFAKRLGEITRSDSLTLPIVEGVQPGGISDAIPGTSAVNPNVTIAEPDHWRVRITTENGGLFSVKSFQDGNWQATITALSNKPEQDGQISRSTQPSHRKTVQVWQVDYLFSGVEIAAGNWEVELVYHPWWITPSLMISVLGIVLAAAFFAKQSLILNSIQYLSR